MSDWNAYIANMESQGADQCGVYMKDNGGPCAQSQGFNVTPQEVEGLKKCMARQDHKMQLNGQNCVMTFSDDGCAQGKSKDAFQNGSKVFYHAECSNNYIVVVGSSGPKERLASGVAGSIASYLKQQGQ